MLATEALRLVVGVLARGAEEYRQPVGADARVDQVAREVAPDLPFALTCCELLVLRNDEHVPRLIRERGQGRRIDLRVVVNAPGVEWVGHVEQRPTGVELRPRAYSYH